MVVTEGKYFLFIKLQQKNIQRKMSHTANSKVHKHFFICIANYLRILNTRAFTWHENMLVYYFVLGYYLFLKAHSSPLALLSENSLHLGTDDVHGPISMHVK